MSVDLSLREVGGVSIVDAPSRMTLGHGAGTLRHSLRDLLVGGHKKILLNLGGVTALDSTGIGDLVASFATINNQGGQLKLLNVTKRVKDLLLLTKLYTVFEVFEDESAAVNSFR
ncbi:MAG TPA: STAS domain-containing protein [Candidatus Acidoferrales bacterium]|nr:STAS domain-containing protein [Candidatus Acidoferrales bacterium]